jgi:hypothetical protein
MHRRAVKSCIDAMEGIIPATRVRAALIAAAKDADILIAEPGQ